jgi:hypothetical protein
MTKGRSDFHEVRCRQARQFRRALHVLMPPPSEIVLAFLRGAYLHDEDVG